MDRPQGTQVGLWKIYYGRLSDRFRALYPHRCPEEISDKLHSMIEKRQMHATSEVCMCVMHVACSLLRQSICLTIIHHTHTFPPPPHTHQVEHWKKIGTHKAQDRDKGSPTKHI